MEAVQLKKMLDSVLKCSRKKGFCRNGRDNQERLDDQSITSQLPIITWGGDGYEDLQDSCSTLTDASSI